MDKWSVKVSFIFSGFVHLLKSIITYSVVVAGVLSVSIGEESVRLSKKKMGKQGQVVLLEFSQYHVDCVQCIV